MSHTNKAGTHPSRHITPGLICEWSHCAAGYGTTVQKSQCSPAQCERCSDHDPSCLNRIAARQATMPAAMAAQGPDLVNDSMIEQAWSRHLVQAHALFNAVRDAAIDILDRLWCEYCNTCGSIVF